ncbi:hypothetical protein ASG59_17485 [Methylobacterium sp. Leaf466]|nr:hypothetical protein ASG59_17485 [Methylobacterium sp. Leaf466]
MGLSFLERTAARHGEDPTVVLDAVRADTPLARTVRGLLRIPPDLPPRSGRPSKVSERLHEYFTIERIRAEGLKGDRVFIEALARLPGRTMTVESLKRTYQHTKKRMTVPAEMKALIKIVEVTKPD